LAAGDLPAGRDSRIGGLKIDTGAAKMITQDVRSAVKADIRSHLLAGRTDGWKSVQKKYPEISKATFFRYRREVELSLTGGNLDPDQEAADASADDASLASVKIARTASEMTTFPIKSPREIAQGYQELFADSQRMRAYALDSKGKVRDPVAFSRSVKMRENALGCIFMSRRELWDMERIEQFYNTIIDVIGEADPEMQRAMMRKLHDFNKFLGN
jgi:hypothetical protein